MERFRNHSGTISENPAKLDSGTIPEDLPKFDSGYTTEYKWILRVPWG